MRRRPPAKKPIKAEEVEDRHGGGDETEETRPTVETKTAGATVVEERSETRMKARPTSPRPTCRSPQGDGLSGRKAGPDRPGQKNNAPEA